MIKFIHTYNNGIKCYRDTIYPQALARYEKYINLHEPFEDTIFEHIIKNNEIKTFVDIGSAWGYYSILAKKLNKNITVVGFDPEKRMIENAYKNMKLNHIEGILFRNAAIPVDTKLFDIIKYRHQIDLLKIDIQGRAFSALDSAGKNITKIKNIIIGIHDDKERNSCSSLLKKHGFKINLNLKPQQIPVQPDGLLWAAKK
jgi:ribosomal protein L11 methylase PrmA